MQTRYLDLIHQTFDFPQDEFDLKNDSLHFHGLDLMGLIEEHGTPLKFTYLPQISNNIQRANNWFNNAIEKNEFKGSYKYFYCTKSSHFSYVIEEALKNGVGLETSSSFDINIIENLLEKGRIKKIMPLFVMDLRMIDISIISPALSIWGVIILFRF
jgi:arginine decarboxylase